MQKKILSDIKLNESVKCVGVKDSSVEFLQFLDKKGISLGTDIVILEKESFDETLKIKVQDKTFTISNKIANNLFVQ